MDLKIKRKEKATKEMQQKGRRVEMPKARSDSSNIVALPVHDLIKVHAKTTNALLIYPM